ncbi:ABC transporter ATP-binding protein [Acetivibrio mesophilus]|uniref:ABC transporter ATP-binding protein n=1 Tax=Acetivibrio mesophilus TaxID=2487273 RepID=A0A4Q0I829_9FIRM|nr:ABC transporter ATP-binding protein [Acetivibrio mesophilus]ODM26380.1 ABC transporter ATP-binding protein [Clostridium sp. Bc-iso-3]RXE60560.1 ABC transporter ATP-binding protein [Acetivibrio mesophilus]
MSKTVLETKDLCKTYIIDKYSNNVLQNVNLKIEEGELVSVMGPSGSGKSTLLYSISGMDTVTSGKVLFDGEDLTQMNEKQLLNIRLLKMGFIFQQMYMMKKLCIMDNIILPGYQAKVQSREEVNKRAKELMNRLGIIDTADREITEVSGGQLQRACLCRALINNPKVLFADEPTGALNSKASLEVVQEILKANKNGTTVMMVTHSEKVASISDRIIYLVDGNIQGEIVLGKMNDFGELAVRERKIKNWLNEMGW